MKITSVLIDPGEWGGRKAIQLNGLGFAAQLMWVLAPGQLFTSSVSLGRHLELSGPQHPHLEGGPQSQPPHRPQSQLWGVKPHCTGAPHSPSVHRAQHTRVQVLLASPIVDGETEVHVTRNWQSWDEKPRFLASFSLTPQMVH